MKSPVFNLSPRLNEEDEPGADQEMLLGFQEQRKTENEKILNRPILDADPLNKKISFAYLTF
jgi:hypothetical protein